MVAIDNHLVVGNISNRVENVFIIFVFRSALELHADLNVFRKQIA